MMVELDETARLAVKRDGRAAADPGGADRHGVTLPRCGWALLALALPAALAAQDTKPRFYHGLPYGSEASYHPLASILHSGFYNYQIDNRGDRPFAQPLGAGIENVLRNLGDPFGTIDAYGWRAFLTSEVLPNIDPDRGQWVPNYFGHVLGEALAFRMAMEWYDARGHEHPWLLGVLSTLTGAVINEAVENGDYRGPNVDPIADLYLFNPLGIALFSSDRVAGFFARRLGMAYWPLQLAYDPAGQTLQNAGYRTAFRIPVAADGRLGAFVTYGVQSLVGASWRLPREFTISAGAGAAASRLIDSLAPRGGRVVTAEIGPAFGLFLDRKGSLLASFVVTPEKQDQVALNIYPGWLGRGGLRPGLSLAWNRLDGMRLSLHVVNVPIGLALGSRVPFASP